METIISQNHLIEKGLFLLGLARCDFCGRVIWRKKLKCVRMAKLQKALCGGFNPFNTTYKVSKKLLAKTTSKKFSKEQLYQSWRYRVMISGADWGFCKRCYEFFEANTNGSYEALEAEADQKDTNEPMPSHSMITPQGAYSVAEQLYDQGQFDLAEKVLSPVVNRTPDNIRSKILLSRILSDRGTHLIGTGKPESGFRDLLRSTEMDPHNWRALVNLCSIAYQRGDFRVALDSGKMAIVIRTHPKTLLKRITMQPS